ncbi:hypothetical protein LGK97_08295 [Clostridium sp. CS001]|uniref:hypothetical protein n=1 Tax=Clostridium sp. CS001 TaxID=2880648 RepID=UPI001CF5927F|nr:hypothetical protein [Clostridium sp. CS001]MCB2289764.1 hypothetical protein [Clostridium sp. CS001]
MVSNKRKLLKYLFISLIAFKLTTNVQAFATTPIPIDLGSEKLPYTFKGKDKNIKQWKDFYLYELRLENTKKDMYIKEQNAYKRTVEGQYFYWTIPTKNWDIQNLDSIRTATNSYKTMSDLYLNSYNNSYGDYGSVYGYPAKYTSGVENRNFKTQTTNPITKLIDKIPDKSQLFVNYKNILGTPRFVFDKNAGYQGTIGFPNDSVSNYTFDFINANLVYQPALTDHLLPWSQGSINKFYIYGNGQWIGPNSFVNSTNNRDKDMLNTYLMFKQVWGSKGLNDFFKRKNIDVNNPVTLDQQIKTFLNYFEVRSFANEQSYGVAQAKMVINGGLYYFTINTPKNYVAKNLHISSVGYAIGSTAVEKEAYKTRVVDFQTGVTIPTTQKLIAGKKYVLKTFMGYENNDALIKNVDTSSTSADIKTNFYGFLNGSRNYSTVELFQPLQSGYKINTFDKNDVDANKYTDKLKAYYSKEFNYSPVLASNLQEYNYIFTIPEEDSNGNKTTKIDLLARIATQDPLNSYCDGKNLEGSDNWDLRDDESWLAFNVTVPPKDIIVANKYNKSTPNIINWTNSYPLDGVNVTRVDGSKIAFEGGDVLYAGEKVNVDVYVARDNKSLLPLEKDNPAMLKDLQMYYTETVNPTNSDLSVKLDNNYKNYDYRTNNRMELIRFWDYNSDLNITKGAKDYNVDTDADIKISTGMVFQFRTTYTIPDWDSIVNDNIKWNTNSTNIYKKASLEKVGLMFNLENQDTFKDGTNNPTKIINENLDNDWVRTDLSIGDLFGRNLTLNKIKVFDEDKNLVKEVYITNNDLISNVSLGTLDATKNYYLEVATRFSYPVNTKTSINKDIKTNVISYYNGQPPTTMDINSGKYSALSNLSNYWKDGDIGLYSPQNGRYSTVDVKSYDPSKNAFNPLIIPIKTVKGVSFGDIQVQIPSVYNPYISGNLNPNDNNILNDWESVTLHYTINKDTKKDNAVVDIQLFDKSAKEYKDATKYIDGTNNSYQSLDPMQVGYYAIITVQRLTGSDVAMVDKLPVLDIAYKLSETGNTINTTLNPYSGKDLVKVGDKIQYRLDDLSGFNGLIDINATLNIPDDNMANNNKQEAWKAVYDFAVQGFEVSPKIILVDKSKINSTQKMNFSANIFYDAFGNTKGNNSLAEKVPIEVREMARTSKDADFKYTGRIMYNEEVNLSNGNPYTIAGLFKYNNTEDITLNANVTYRYVIAINGGITGSFNYYKYAELDRTNNQDSSDISVYKATDTIIDCSNVRISNTWSNQFYYFQKNGVLKQRQAIACSKDGGCWPYTIYWCENVTTFTDNPVVTYREGYSITNIMFRSESTSSQWIDVLTEPSKAIVRAGQWFEVQIKTQYNTNRNAEPYRRFYYDMCNYGTLSPNLSPIYRPQGLNVQFNVSPVQVENYSNVQPTGYIGDWYARTATFSPFGKRYVPVNTKDLDMKLLIQTNAVQGYESDPNHPKVPLKDCKTVVIKVQGPVPVTGGATSVQ